MPEQRYTDADVELVAVAAHDLRTLLIGDGLLFDDCEQIARAVLDALAAAGRLQPVPAPVIAGWPVPSVYVQWKGTDACLDFHCECGAHGHVDDYFAYGVRCSMCGRVYTLPDTLALTEGEPDNELVVAVETELWRFPPASGGVVEPSGPLTAEEQGDER